MTTDQITISVEPDIARAYREASEDDRRKFDLLLSLRLRDALSSEGTLQDLMRQIGRNARVRGLTPEILESILNDQ